MIARGVWLDCADDAEACEAALKQAEDEARELWCGARLVGTFESARKAG
jgi:hypothetical protein